MIVERKIDIFKSSMQTITNPVNVVGVMGKGLALAFKQRYPGLIIPYENACRNREFEAIGLFIYNSDDYKILCFPTKHHWKDPSDLNLIEDGLKILASSYRWYDITSISLPALGCGLGGLEWNTVRSLIYHYFEDHPLEVEVIPQ